MYGVIFTGVTYGLVALIMIGIGVSQLKSKKPVAFYSGEKAPDEEEISDVKTWNRKHGIMWVLYGIIIVISWLCSCMLGDSIVTLVPLLGGVIIPIGFMIWYHHRLTRKYRTKR